MKLMSDSERRRPSSQALGEIVGRLRRRFERTVYVDATEVPDEPLSPYRARLNTPEQQPDTGVEVRERDVVRGTIDIVYEIRCACGRRWFNRNHDRVQLCPRCARAVLLESAS
jgi:hypothetical protein